MERLHISEIDFVRIIAPSFKYFPERLSNDSTFIYVHISFSNCSTRCSVTFENLNLERSRPKIF